ncbi:HAD-IIB family hydrolase [Echinimonas agarilytica]|uniref:HAD-IIB family hydrolase n=1 Tax=Echinimonas agarilytica TaxID=1215918 RepID=A0AA41W5K8_9GAMM|nr:HAD-IIB family hydrolase [Echinimonas agarilytica]MCM2679260.1 HAD-IIB family hydrolase [Echinimonas agarilytica]
MIKHPLIFTDLDGTLLDHYSYSFEAAKTTLAYCSEQRIPVIANTSKTCAELIHIRKEINNSCPFIVENGAAIYLPKKLFPTAPEGCIDDGALWQFSFSKNRQHWVDLLHHLKPRFQSLYTSFSNISIEDISQLTGLNLKQAERASQRQFGEPVLWHGNREDKALFVEAIEQLGGHVLQGGRFLHVGGSANKGTAMQWLKNIYTQQSPEIAFETIALGDSDNDIDMLESADHAVVIASPIHDPLALKRTKNTIFTQSFGPIGWAESLSELLNIPEQSLLEKEK